MADEGYEMKKIQELILLLIILSYSNFCTRNDTKIMLLNKEIDQLSQRFIVDKSLSFNSALITKNDQDLEIRGKTTSKDLYNELMIFWNFGVTKIQLMNFFIRISLIFMFIQILLVSIIVPSTQNYSRILIKDSNINFFESFIKPKRFNDNIKGLTIFAEEKKNNGELKNIYLKKETDKGNFQITYAKSGDFISKNNTQILMLKDGQTINKINDDLTTFNFQQSNLNMSSQVKRFLQLS